MGFDWEKDNLSDSYEAQDPSGHWHSIYVQGDGAYLIPKSGESFDSDQLEKAKKHVEDRFYTSFRANLAMVGTELSGDCCNCGERVEQRMSVYVGPCKEFQFNFCGGCADTLASQIKQWRPEA